MGKGIVNFPMPVALVGAKIDGHVNFLTAAWISMVNYNPPKISVSLGKHHFTNQGIKENQAFSICFPSLEHIKITDLCGLVSGKNDSKSDYFDVFYGESENAPMINDFALNVECKLDKIVENGTNDTFIGDIIGIYADASILSNGIVDLDKLNPLILGQVNAEYRILGEKVGQAWKIGKD